MPQTVARSIPDRCLHCALRGASLCRLVEAADLPRARPVRLRRIPRNGLVFEQGKQHGTIGMLRRGYLRKERLNRVGRRTVFDLAFPGDIIGELPGHSLSYSLEAATDAEICVFDDRTVRRMMATDGQFRLGLLQATADQLARLQETIWQRGALTCRERILAFLVLSARAMPTTPRPDGSIIVTIELARKDWAAFSNTTVESISRVMSQLSEKGLVKTLAPDRYWIADPAFLARLAGMDPRADCAPPQAAMAARRHNRRDIAA
ncbi:Crp/Fnr family transcriptional regulator [Stappia taiwanensis]|uniref:Crp/Fnr family transcriptional regulator n=1 Tax=Stappia taiwanensis TaxID=992267 RepID=A0A838XSX0_9HYPH|nr:Crp/Fnr family transcriptional regulator [Stappia taiwanensis]MBA4610113.1 Crp/Fnr family transcriptional regulator [Stappia taiwanensis]GGE77014.1 hypothetical protein GCM10007285_00990 [Stappia taiwanensis]